MKWNLFVIEISLFLVHSHMSKLDSDLLLKLYFNPSAWSGPLSVSLQSKN